MPVADGKTHQGKEIILATGKNAGNNQQEETIKKEGIINLSTSL